MEDLNTEFSDFAAALGIDGDNHTAQAEDTASTAEQQAPESSQEAPESHQGEDGSNEDTAASEESAQEGSEESPAEGAAEQMFTIKVDKGTRTVGLEELKELAQKGGAFDRVKGQLTESRKTNESLQTELSAARKVSDAVARMAQNFNVTPEELLKRVHVNWLMSQGDSEKEALAKIDAIEAKNALEEMKAKAQPAQETEQDRAKREVAEFRQAYPDVDLSRELVEQLTPEVQNGTSLIRAYEKLEAAKKEAEAAALREENRILQLQLEAEKKNARNRTSTPGRQKDSGGQRDSGDFEDFLKAFQ